MSKRENPFPTKATHPAHIKDPQLRKELIRMRKSEHSFERALGLIMNSLFTETTDTVWLSQRKYNELAAKYSGQPFEEIRREKDLAGRKRESKKVKSLPNLNAPIMSGAKFSAFRKEFLKEGLLVEVIPWRKADSTRESNGKKDKGEAGVYRLGSGPVADMIRRAWAAKGDELEARSRGDEVEGKWHDSHKSSQKIRDYYMIRSLLETGVRVAEFCALVNSDIQGQRLLVRCGKGGKLGGKGFEPLTLWFEARCSIQLS
jgi:integrase